MNQGRDFHTAIQIFIMMYIHIYIFIYYYRVTFYSPSMCWENTEHYFLCSSNQGHGR